MPPEIIKWFVHNLPNPWQNVSTQDKVHNGLFLVVTGN